MALDVSIGMKRPMLERLRDELTRALRSDAHTVGVELDLNTDHFPSSVQTLRINNDDMERDEVPAGVVYCDAEPVR